MTETMIIDNALLDTLSVQAEENPRLRQHMDLRNSVEDTSQRMLNALVVGTQVPVHRHESTSETMIVLRGALDVVFYDEEGKETERVRLNPLEGRHGLNIPMGQLHSVEVIEPSVIFEAKDGRYEG